MKLSKIQLIFIIILAIILILSFAKSNHNPKINQNTNNSNNISKVCIKENCFSVELAISNEEKQRGLMFKESLDKDKGMLFIYNEESKQSFWMKDTLIPLDIIWIDKYSKIVNIATVEPCKKDPCEIYSPDENALYILEINAGLTNEDDIKEGDIVVIRR